MLYNGVIPTLPTNSVYLNYVHFAADTLDLFMLRCSN